MQWGITQTSSSHSSSTLLPCNFSVECPTHLPHITALSLTPPTPWKTLHASTYTATWPKYTAPLSLLLSACSDTLYALATPGFPLSYLLYVCVCVHKCFVCAPYCAAFLFFSPPVRVRPAERHQSFPWLLQLAFQFVGRKCQGGPWCGWIQGERLREGGSRDSRPWGHCLEICYQHRTRPCQHQLTLGYRDTETTAGRVCLNSGSKHGTGQSAALTAALPLAVKSTHWAGLLFALELNITYFKHKVCQTLWWLCHVIKICITTVYWWCYYGWCCIIMSRVSICASNALS